MNAIDGRTRPRRRDFLAAVAGLSLSPALLRAAAPADDLPKDLKITRAVAFDLKSKRNKLAGKNARLDVHGDSATDPMLRLYTSDPTIQGVGVCRAKKEDVAKL